MKHPTILMFDSINKLFEAERKKIWEGVPKNNECETCQGRGYVDTSGFGDYDDCEDCIGGIKKDKKLRNRDKKCCKCKLFKMLSEFHKNRTVKDGYQCVCKECRKQYKRERPWEYHLYRLIDRCKYSPRYNGEKKLILNFLTEEDIKYLWFRDKAYLLEKPSVDRIDSNGNYILHNCQFIEQSLNSGKDNKGNKSHLSKLNKRQVIEIKKLLVRGKKQITIARHYKVTPSCINLIARGNTWKWIIL